MEYAEDGDCRNLLTYDIARYSSNNKSHKRPCIMCCQGVITLYALFLMVVTGHRKKTDKDIRNAIYFCTAFLFCRYM